jgi:hypothetical protein
MNAMDRYWIDNYVNEESNLCSLCGNSGVIDTRSTAISHAGVEAGRLNYCICPNGRSMRDQQAPLSNRLARPEVTTA